MKQKIPRKKKRVIDNRTEKLLSALAHGNTLLGRQKSEQLKEFHQHVPDASSSAVEWAKYVQQRKDIFNGCEVTTEMLRSTSMNTKEHNKAKLRVLRGFMNALAAHKELHPLAEEHIDENGYRTFLIFHLLAGSKQTEKHALLNTCLIVWGMTLKKQEYQNIDLMQLPPADRAKAQLQPGSVAKLHRILFKILKDNSIQYAISDFNHQGSFNAIWKEIFKVTSEWRPDYGNKPHQAVVVIDDYKKMRECKLLDPFKNVLHCLYVLAYRMASEFFLRSQQEVRYPYSC